MNNIPHVGFLRVISWKLTFKSLFGFPLISLSHRCFNLSIANPIVVGMKSLQSIYLLIEIGTNEKRLLVSMIMTKHLSYKTVIIQNMSKTISETKIGHDIVKIIKIKRPKGGPDKPKYAGYALVPEEGTVPFITHLNGLEKGRDYEAIFEFEEGWRGEKIINIKRFYVDGE